MEERKIRVGVIFGGRSAEHAVSLRSAAAVMDALDPDKYEVFPIGITLEGRWFGGSDALHLLEDGVAETVQSVAFLGTPMHKALMAVEHDKSGGTLALHEVTRLDVVFPVLHGPYGEDGTVQGLLELAGIPYVGSGVVGSALGMDKAVFKAVMQAHGLPVLPYILITRRQWEGARAATLDAIEAAIPYPAFVKPANMGSSVGISKVAGRAELAAGLDKAARYDRRLLVEQGIVAREIEVSVLGNEDVIASVPGEVMPSDAFYTYDAKYIEESKLCIPAELADDVADAIRAMARRAFHAIDGAGLGRVDLLLDVETGKPYINEINTLPGFTEISMYPKLWEASGLPYPELVDRLIVLALERYADKERNECEYRPD